MWILWRVISCSLGWMFLTFTFTFLLWMMRFGWAQRNIPLSNFYCVLSTGIAKLFYISRKVKLFWKSPPLKLHFSNNFSLLLLLIITRHVLTGLKESWKCDLLQGIWREKFTVIKHSFNFLKPIPFVGKIMIQNIQMVHDFFDFALGIIEFDTHHK